MLVGFSIFFMATIGTLHIEYSTFSKAYLATASSSLGDINFDLVSDESVIVIFIIFNFIYRILLANMFIAIISAHYFQFQRESEEDSAGEEENIDKLILGIVRSELR